VENTTLWLLIEEEIKHQLLTTIIQRQIAGEIQPTNKENMRNWVAVRKAKYLENTARSNF
jgi:hypothetical protein